MLIHDIRSIREWREEHRTGAIEKTLSSGKPWRCGIIGGDIGESGTTEEDGGDVVRPLIAIDLRAVDRVVCTIIDVEVAINEVDAGHPIVDLVCPIGVKGVACEASESSSELEEAAVGDGGLVVETGIVGVELPLETTVTS